MAQSESEQLQSLKAKNKKLKELVEKKDYFHEQESNLMRKQIHEYRETVETQAMLIQELQRKISLSSKSVSHQSLPYPSQMQMQQQQHHLDNSNYAHYSNPNLLTDQENNQLMNNSNMMQMTLQR